jgi:hypothetical protein
MKKIAFGILIALVAASPAAAAKKSKKMVAAEPPAAAANPNEAGWRFVRDSLPIYYPTAVKAVIYPVGNNKQK